MPRKISYASVVKAYKKVKTPKQAVKQAHLKWRFWASCTEAERKDAWLAHYCGLCKIYKTTRCPLIRNKNCPVRCCKLYGLVVDAKYNGTLSTFHAAAQKLADRIERIKV